MMSSKPRPAAKRYITALFRSLSKADLPSLSLSSRCFIRYFGYSVADPMGVRISFLVMGVLILIGLLLFRGYKLGDTPEDVKQFMVENKELE